MDFSSETVQAEGEIIAVYLLQLNTATSLTTALAADEEGDDYICVSVIIEKSDGRTEYWKPTCTKTR